MTEAPETTTAEPVGTPDEAEPADSVLNRRCSVLGTGFGSPVGGVAGM